MDEFPPKPNKVYKISNVQCVFFHEFVRQLALHVTLSQILLHIQTASPSLKMNNYIIYKC